MKKICKFPLKITDAQEIGLPIGSQILSVQDQGGTLCLWAVVDTTQLASLPQRIRIVGTGNPFPDADNCEFISTAQQGHLVWHVFRVTQ